MAIIKVAWVGIKKRKVYSISIFLLVFMIALLSNIGVSMMQRVSQIYDETLKKTNSVHIEYYFDDMYSEKVKTFEKWFEKDNRIKEVKVTNILTVEGEVYNFKDKDKDQAYPKICLYPNSEKYMNQDNEVIELDIDYDEIALPIYYQNIYHLSEGDSFEIFLGDTTVSLKIDSFFVEPLHGSEMTMVKTAILNPDRLNDMIKLSDKLPPDPTKMVTSYTMGIVIKEEFINNIKEINEDFYTNNEVPMNESLSIELYKKGSLLITNIILFITIAFSILLFLIIILVIRSAINSAIETDFTNIGTLKALGFSSFQILMTIILQFSTLAFIGTIFGVGISMLIIPSVGNIVLSTTGLIWFGFPSVLTMLMILLILLLLINGIVYITSRKVMKITPVEAISSGKSDVYFNSVTNIPMEKLSILPLNFRMGLKQILTKVNQYIMLIIIGVVLSFAVGITLMTASIFGDFETTFRIFGFNKINMGVTALEEETVEDIMEEISLTYNVDYYDLTTYQNVLVGSESILAIVYKDFEKGNLHPIKGRFPRYDNEISLTETLASFFGKKIGDTLIVSDVTGEEKLEFIITGYHQNVNNMGTNIYLTSDGLKRIDKKAQLRNGELLIDETLDIDKIVGELEQKYEKSESGVAIYKIDTKSTMLVSIKSVLSGVTLGIFILISLITSIITMLLAFIVIHKENKELGIYKALGYDSFQMRLQLAARYGIVTLIGALIGSILCFLFGVDLLGIMFSLIGIGEIEVEFTLRNFLTPIGLISFVAFLVAFAASKRIGKVSTRDLICE